MDDSVDVVVIGAGAAGLYATADLTDGFRVACLEARERVGGRLLSVPAAGGGGAVDLGASWFWPGEHRVAKLVRDLGLATHAQHVDGDALYEQPRDVVRLSGNPIDVPALRYSSGAQNVAAALAAGIPAGVVRLGRAVTSLTFDGQTVVAHTDAGGLRAAHAIIALPPALAVHAIMFRPALPDRLRALAQATPVWMGAVTKAVVEYTRPFWRSNGLSGAAMSHIGPLREIHDLTGPHGQPAALFGFAAAAGRARQITADDVIEQMTRLFGASAAQPRRVTVQDWAAEAYTSPPTAARLSAYELLGHADYARPAWHGRLHWAGTETATTAPGHLEGALAAGARAAEAVRAASHHPTSNAPGR